MTNLLERYWTFLISCVKSLVMIIILQYWFLLINVYEEITNNCFVELLFFACGGKTGRTSKNMWMM